MNCNDIVTIETLKKLISTSNIFEFLYYKTTPVAGVAY